jgi:hypothetical protein
LLLITKPLISYILLPDASSFICSRYYISVFHKDSFILTRCKAQDLKTQFLCMGLHLFLLYDPLTHCKAC